MLVANELACRHEFVVKPPRLDCVGPSPVRAKRERVLLLAGNIPALGDVLARLTHRLGRIPLGIRRIDESPTERRVIERPLAAGICPVGLRCDERRTRHRLHTTGNEQIAVTGDHRVAGANDRGKTGSTETVDRDTAH